MATKVKEKVPIFDKSELIAAAHVFGTCPELMAGALYNVDGPISKDTAAKKLEAFLKKPVGGK